MYKSEFEWFSNPHKPPCYVGKECKHKQETMGRCREQCVDYIKFQSMRKDMKQGIHNNYVSNEYKRESCDRMARRYG